MHSGNVYPNLYVTRGTRGEVADIRIRIEDGNRFEQFLEIAERNWPEDVYMKVKTVTGDIRSAAKDQDLAIITIPDHTMARGLARRFRERFGWAQVLIAQGKQLGSGYLPGKHYLSANRIWIGKKMKGASGTSLQKLNV
nr:unnamed protein product [Callosobruchus analis]